MKAYPVFLLPKGQIMMTAKIDGDKIKILKETLFPSNKRYSISESGLAACLDNENNHILYGNLKEDGEMKNVTVLPFPNMISPKSICILKNHLILGGENKYNYSQDIESHELVATYSIIQNKFTSVEMPFKLFDKSIDDLLLDNNKVIAVDNIVYPKYILEYDFENPDLPLLVASYTLPNNSVYETIKKGTLNETYIALLSSSGKIVRKGNFINIFRRGNYNNYIRLSPWHGVTNQNIDKIYYWNDILLIPNSNVLLIPSYENGIGIYYIDDSMIFEENNEDSVSIQYINRWKKKCKKNTAN